MSIKPPVLDGRNQNDIISRLSELAKIYLPEWTQQDNDPGMMLQRIYARLMEIALERFNKVPEKNLLAFLNIAGVSQLAPTPAYVPVTFFALKGAASSMVPKGTQVSTKPEGQKKAVIFETVEDLTVLSAQLVSMVTVDPVFERYTMHSLDFSNSETGFMPFYGLKNIKHIIYIGCHRLFDFNKAKVSVSLWVEPCEEDVKGFLKNLLWEYKYNDQNAGINSPVLLYNRDAAFLKVDLGEINEIEESMVQGVSENPKIIEGLNNRWLKASVPEGLFNISTARALKIKKIQIQVGYENMLPDAVFYNDAALDVTKEIRPFGITPQLGDCFYIGCKQALLNRGSRITLKVKTVNKDTNVSAKLKWEILTAKGWQEVYPDIQSDDPKAASQSACFLKDADFIIDFDRINPLEKDGGSIDFDGRKFSDRDDKIYPYEKETKFCELVKWNGLTNCWLRVRIVDGNYGLPLELEAVGGSFVAKKGTGGVTPPVIKELTISYTVEGSPDSIVSENGFLVKEHLQKAIMSPFVPVCDLNSPYADEKPALYLGLDKIYSDQPVSIYAAAHPGIISSPLVSLVKDKKNVKQFVQWEYFNGIKWSKLPVIDSTQGFTQSGSIKFLMPDDIKPLSKFDHSQTFWIKAFSNDETSSMTEAQWLQGIYLNTVEACQGTTVKDQILGSSDGNPNQRMNLKSTSLVEGQQIFVREPEIPSEDEKNDIYREEGNDAILEFMNTMTGEKELWIRWHEVPNFIGSKASNRHYVLDHATGIITFGNGRNGLIPPRGVNSIKATFRVGGGMNGNIERGTVTLIKSPLPGIASVNNPVAADGGSELEVVKAIKERGPSTIRHRNYAASHDDFELLVRQACGTRVARVKCLPNRNKELILEPGWVTLVIVPNAEGAKVEPSSELLERIEAYIQKKAFGGLTEVSNTRIHITGPSYVRISVDIEIVPQDIGESQAVKQRVLQSLNDFLHPLKGGPLGTGWDFGRNVFISELCHVIEGIKGVDHINLDATALRGGWLQQRINIKKPFTAPKDMMPGSIIKTLDYKKSAVLATPMIYRNEVTSLDMKSFKEEDGITGVIDLLVKSKPGNPYEADIDGNTVTVETMRSLDSNFSFPQGCRVSLFDCSDSTELLEVMPIKGSSALNIKVKNERFIKSLKPGMCLTVFLPNVLTVKSIHNSRNDNNQAGDECIFLQVEDYGHPFVFPSSDCIMATMDNRIRLPLKSFTLEGEKVVQIGLEDFIKGEKIIFQGLEVQSQILDMKEITDLVYLEDNFLVYPGDHMINIESEKNYF